MAHLRAQTIKALESAERQELMYSDSFKNNKSGYYYDKEVKYGKRSADELFGLITRVEYSPMIWRYGLSPQGKAALVEARAQAKENMEKAETAMNASTIAIGGCEYIPGASLQAADVISIRHALAQGVKQGELAEIYSVRPQVISGIARNKLYKWVK